MRLTPRNTQFFDLFSTAAEHVQDATRVMASLVAADPAGRADLVRRMTDLEHAGDACVHAVMKALNTSFITPFDREDIALLAARLDDVLDELEEAAQLTELYRVAELPDGVRRQVALLERAAALTVPAMRGLAGLDGLTDYWVGVNEIENEADQVYRAALATLFDTETDAIALLKVKEVLDRLEEAADAFEHVANVVQSIAAKES
jgi:predicted phosphate transport protein (TIGR00153 family)